MFGKAWQWLTARSGRQQGPLRLFVDRHPMYQSSWRPIVTPDKQPGMEIQIYLEASNLASSAYRIVAAEIADMPAIADAHWCARRQFTQVCARQSSPAAAAHNGIAPLPDQRAIPFER